MSNQNNILPFYLFTRLSLISSLASHLRSNNWSFVKTHIATHFVSLSSLVTVSLSLSLSLSLSASDEMHFKQIWQPGLTPI